MGFCLTPQRRAIEVLRFKARVPPSGMEKQPLTLTDGRSIFLWGVSEGVGSCSDIKGMHVLVVGLTPPGMNPAEWSRWHHPTQQYAYIVLRRAPTNAEQEVCYRSNPWKPAIACVELLRYVGTDESGRLRFECTGEVETYINLV